jgi:alkylation response protein AidB-like acyl-CoA dehydrogenase
MTTTHDASPHEAVDAFRTRARTWLGETFAAVDAGADPIGEDPIGDRLRAEGRADTEAERGRTGQRMLWEGGFAGITYPQQYGGQGLTAAHLHAFTEEARGYDLGGCGSMFAMTLGMMGPTLLDLGSDELKARYLPGMIRGDDLWVQFLSEPTGGSDLAGAVTRATRDGDHFLLSGSKVWTSAADYSDYGFCLARTDWDVPKHRGLTMFVVPLRAPGIEVIPLRLVTGATGFCQEFFDDVAVPATDVVGDVDDGWNVASRLLVHERNAIAGGSEFHDLDTGGTRARGGELGARHGDLTELARARGLADDSRARQLVAEAHVLTTVNRQLSARLQTATTLGVLPPAAGSLLKLFGSTAHVRTSDITMELAGESAVVWPGDDRAAGLGVEFLFRQATSILSGTSEIQRNIISERVLGLPREPAPDRDVPFRDVRHNRMPDRDGS